MLSLLLKFHAKLHNIEGVASGTKVAREEVVVLYFNEIISIAHPPHIILVVLRGGGL